MTRRFFPIVLLLIGRLLTAQASANTEVFEFFAAEAEAIRVFTASRFAHSLRWAPATVYVLTAEEIQASGAKTLWDALRRVPGVDVMSTRTFYGEVSIRGLNRALNNRTLVLLDGRTVLNGPFDATYWEGIPVELTEIDRIEVVEGPASALYGANAINGVINIITRVSGGAPEGKVSYSAGERRTHLGGLTCGGRRGKMRYGVSAGFRTTNRFENGSLRASEVGKSHVFMGYDLSGERRLSLSGGMVNHNTEFSIGSGGAALVDGTDGFLRADYRHGDTRFRAFWNRGRSNWKEFEGTKDPTMDSDVYDLTLEHSLSLPFENRLVVGGGYRRNTMRSNIYAPERIDQDLWALFFEEEWRPAKAWSFVTSGRMDRHPFTGWVFSPRGSLVFSPTPEHVFRLSAGTSFRNPTLTENNLNLTVNYRSPLNIPIKVVILGDLDLKAERMVMVDVGHSGHFGPVKTTVAGFHYRIKDLASVRSDSPKVVLQPTLEIRVPTFYFNTQQETRAWGGELGIEATANRQVTVFANYSYQRLTGELDFQVSSNGGPKHKLNGGVRIRSGGLTFSLQAHWVGRTFWNNASLSDLVTQNIEVDSYFLLNPHIGYTFSGSLKGLEVGFDGFNILDRQHFEILPTRAETDLGQSGEIVRRRMTATLSYGF